LSGPHGATATQLGITQAVDEVRASDEQIQVHRPVLAVFEGAEAVQDQGFFGGGAGPFPFVKQETVPTEMLGQSLNGAVGDTGLAGDLSKARAGDESVEEGFKEIGAF
jgi:hypothetical protein